MRLVTLIHPRVTLHLSTMQQWDGSWSAIDTNTYDADFIGGEFDEWKESGWFGRGDTEQEAIDEMFDAVHETAVDDDPEDGGSLSPAGYWA